MPRRLLLNSYSDEDNPEESNNNQQQRQQHFDDDEVQFRRSSVDSFHSSAPNPNPSEPVQISDDDEDFVDVSDNLSPPSSHLNNYVHVSSSDEPPPVAPVGTSESSGCPVGDCLSRMGLRLRREWLDTCIRGIQGSALGLDATGIAKLCFEQFLFSDMNYCGSGVLPPNVDSMHLVDLPGPFVLQVDEIVNISCPLKGRYYEAPAGVKRCLNLSMTDGMQRVFGMEYRPIKDLKILAPAGLKVVICNVHIRHGLLMLVPEAVEVLGGMVEELETARQCLVDEVNKPPRGKRSKTGVVPSLATRATLAAWPQNDDRIPGNVNSSTNVRGHTNSSVDISRPTNASILPNVTPFQEDNQGANLVEPGTHTSDRISEEFSVPLRAQNTTTNSSNGVISDFEEMHIDPPPVSRESVVSNQHSNHVSDHEDLCMVDEFEHPIILSRDREIPFTYLASLSSKWASMKEKAASVQGKVKCFLTGLKEFHYQQRTTYELHVYVDDGSLISEILIDHNVMENTIGHSPQEVTAALSSSDTKVVAEMKDTLRQFQKFLANFEGIMLIEMNRTSPLPVALQMNQGCPASAAWLLMRRLKPSSAQTSRSSSVNPITISP